jgi:hypothetical protein
MSRLTGGLAALALLVFVSAGVVAQPPRVQDMAFGGGGHYEFLIPVQAQGRIFVQATWDANVSMEAALYSPDRAHAVRVTRGTGIVQISQEVISWRAGAHWLLKLTAEQDAPDLRGKLHVVWPAGNRPASVVRWQNAGPLDPDIRLAMKDGARRLTDALATRAAPASAAAADPAVRADLRRLATTLATRLDLLDQVPDRYVVNDIDPWTATMRVGPQLPSRDQALQASLLEVVCLNHKPWHTHGESDDPFVVAAFLGDGARLDVARTAMFEAVHTGDAPVASAAGQDLVRADGQGVRYLAVALYEGEGGSPDETTAHFQRAVELYELYATLNGGDSPSAFAWIVAITTENVNDVIGTPHLIAITPSLDSLSPTIRLAFAGHGARYQVAVHVESR